MPKGQPIYHAAPEKDFLPDMPKEALMAEFARRLQAEMAKKGWNQTDLARQASLFLPEGESLSRDLVSRWVLMKNLPHPTNLEAVARALGVAKEELLPFKLSAAVTKSMSSVELKELSDGRVWLRINEPVDWEVGLRILNIIKGIEE